MRAEVGLIFNPGVSCLRLYTDVHPFGKLSLQFTIYYIKII